jgi:LuxR family maltose regulon positive regulatory protein
MHAPAPAEAPGIVLVATKLHAPAVRRGMVARDVLVLRLAAGRYGKLALVCAPAGWGKTVLLSQWRKAEQRPFAWVSLDPADDDPVRFWSYVIGALRTLVHGFGEGVLAALPNAGPGLVDLVLPRLINELAGLPEPVVLVLDDYHLLRDPLIHESVGFLLRHAPRTIQLALATRTDPPLPLARLRAAGELVEIRADELQFDDDEADALLNGALGLGLEPADVSALQERTEGWPAGLQLAALSLRAREDRAAYVRSLAGDDRQIGDYLHEVIEDAPRALREFLLRTSVLERMCAPLCEAVTEREDAGALLGEAFRANLFIVALDDQGHWFRYHHLLRDLLRRELGSAEPELVPRLHARAYAWHARHGNVDEAIEHAIAAGLIDEARELIARHWLAAWQANLRAVDRWIDALPPEAVAADARVALARAWSAMFMGRLSEVEEMIVIAEAATTPGTPRDELGSITSKAALVRACVAYFRGDLQRTYALARFALTDVGPAGEAIGSMLIGLARLFRGQGDSEPFERARRLSTNLPQALITALAGLITIRVEGGEPADELAAEAAALIEERGLAASPAASLAYSARGQVLEHSGDLAGAQELYERAAAAARRAAWPLDLAHALILEAGVRRRRKDFAGARALAREARTALAGCADAGVLPKRLERLERSARETSPGIEELSERELAVLRLLATELSQREIGAQLYVSFNTVKTHTRTVFRKLGVTTRADAVARGRELELI